MSPARRKTRVSRPERPSAQRIVSRTARSKAGRQKAPTDRPTNCSDAVAENLSDHVRAVCDEAIRAAGREERKTVLDRDVPKVRR